jgi:hypothetical protein
MIVPSGSRQRGHGRGATIVFLGSLDFCPAMWTELGANENHAETRRTGDGSQTGAAMFARTQQRWRWPHRNWAIERRSFH